jgi:Bacterial DNA-binding protein
MIGSSCVVSGSFSIRHRKARIGRNPATGDKVQVSDKGYSYFKTGKSMLDRRNRAIAGSALSAPRARLMAYSAADVLRQGQGVSRL